MSSNANSFLSMGQSTQMAGYPKLTPQSKFLIKGNDHVSAQQYHQNQHQQQVSRGFGLSASQTQQNLRNKHKVRMLRSQDSQADQTNSDESCDFFSDNVSETGAGAVPENQAYLP